MLKWAWKGLVELSTMFNGSRGPLVPTAILSRRQRDLGSSAITSATVCALAAPGANRTLRRGRPSVCSSGSRTAGRSFHTLITEVTANTYHFPASQRDLRALHEERQTRMPG